jgi:V/A-type H+-transporting ATPase subunit A
VSIDAGPSRAVEVVGVKDAIVRIRMQGAHLIQNEVVHIPVGERELQAEVLRIRGGIADLQVFEDTSGIRIGTRVRLTGELMSATLGPGLLGEVFDGLQNPLHGLAAVHGTFLERGARVPPLDPDRTWDFTPEVSSGERREGGDVLGSVRESHLRHRVCVPPDWTGRWHVASVADGPLRSGDAVATLVGASGETRPVTMSLRWPVRRAFAQPLLLRRAAERRYPTEPLITTMRLIDTFFPVALGGTACIPGPFGAGKTVLQNLIARYAAVDVVVIVACGERAGEVVETLTELPRLPDPRTGGTLMQRTVLVCNTSSMPVAARESSVYLGMTIAEYYRNMGLDVLVLADSTSRWAQALREVSGLLEEIPGDEAFPAYLDSRIKALYDRAGVIRHRDGRTGSMTLIGTVSPAGGNFDEPVTQATLGTVKTFLGLSAERAYRRFYPAVDPLLSWSRYAAQLEPWRRQHLGTEWLRAVDSMLVLLRAGREIEQVMEVTGEEGVSLEDFLGYLRARLVDAAYLQQNAYDPVDVSTPLARQREMLLLLQEVVGAPCRVDTKAAARGLFDRLTQALTDLNYSAQDSDDYRRGVERVREIVAVLRGDADDPPDRMIRDGDG